MLPPLSCALLFGHSGHNMAARGEPAGQLTLRVAASGVVRLCVPQAKCCRVVAVTMISLLVILLVKSVPFLHRAQKYMSNTF